jgi:spore coat protein CotH
MALASAGLPAPVAAQTAAQLFDRSTVHELRMFVNSRDLANLHLHYDKNTYYPADFDWDGTRVRNVAIRSRGSGSRNPVKLGLRVDFNRYVDGQTFQGLSSVVLDNLWQDPALIRESIAMALFARMEYHAPRESFVRFYINDVYQGLYSVVEPVDARFLDRTFGQSSGYLYEYEWVRYFYGDYPGDELDRYADYFSPENHEEESDTLLYAPLRDMFREFNGGDDDHWAERVDRYLDLPQFVKYVAIESFVSEIDGILGGWGMNNFYLYRLADHGGARLIPWDKDVAFSDIGSPIMLRAEQNVIFRRAMAHPDLRSLYLNVLDECARRASEDDWLVTEVETTAALVSDAAHADPLKQFSNAHFDAGIAFLREFARQRPAVVRAQTGTYRQH